MSFEIVYHLRRYLEKLPQFHFGHKLSFIPSAYDPRDYRYEKLIGITAAEKPVPIDYRPQLPPAFDQEDRGTCVACASAWTLKAYQEIKQEDYPEEGLSASFLYSMCKQNDGMPCLEGTQPKVAMQVLKKNGICPETIMPYSDLLELSSPRVPKITGPALETAVIYRIKTYAQICSSSDKDRTQVINTIREALKNEGPFILALMVCENFSPDENYVLPLPAGDLRGGHAVGIAGDLPEKNCLILRNSWGKKWGENGYAYLPYAWLDNRISGNWSISEAWTATDLTPERPAEKITITPGLKTIKVDGRRTPLENAAIFSKGSPNQTTINEIVRKMGYSLHWEGNKAVFTHIL